MFYLFDSTHGASFVAAADDKLVMQPTHAKEKSSLDGDDSLKNRKQVSSGADVVHP